VRYSRSNLIRKNAVNKNPALLTYNEYKEESDMKQLFYRLPLIFITIWLLTIMGPALDNQACWAQEETTQTDTTGDEVGPMSEGGEEATAEGEEGTSDTSEFSNPAQASHAESLAAASAEKANAEAQEEMDAVAAAEVNLAEAEESGDDDAIKAAQEALDAANGELETKMAGIAGVTTSDIAGMRADGMGWGQIAHSLGIHPGVLGLGHTKGDVNSQFGANTQTASTTRDTKGGLAVGHGIGTGNSSGSKGLGLGHASGNQGNRGGNGGGNAYGGGQGSGHGGGHGGGSGK
jgi:hypothetical protein